MNIRLGHDYIGICSHVPACSLLSADTFQPWAREVRHKDLNALDFDSLYTETFNEEQSIKRNEVHSNINLGSALKAGNGKEKEESTNDSGKTSSRRSFRRWKCKTYKTNEHAWRARRKTRRRIRRKAAQALL